MTQTIPRTDLAVREWARDSAEITAACAGRVYFGVPTGTPTFPLLVVTLVAGGPTVNVDAPIHEPLVQFDCWGPQTTQGVSDGLAEASTLAFAVVNAVEQFTCGTAMGDAAIGLWAEIVSGPRWAPAPEDNRARYLVDVLFGVRPIAA